MRVYLSEWEWACCGEPFAVDEVAELKVSPVSHALAAHLGDLGSTVEAVESHHESEDVPTRTVRGFVRAIDAVYVEHTVTRRPTEPAKLAAADAENRRRRETAAAAGGDVYLAASVPPFTTMLQLIAGVTGTVSVTRVPTADADPEVRNRSGRLREQDAPALDRVEALDGYIVDIAPGDLRGG